MREKMEMDKLLAQNWHLAAWLHGTMKSGRAGQDVADSPAEVLPHCPLPRGLLPPLWRLCIRQKREKR